MNKQSPKHGIILLAAGASTRLGRAKQLLIWQGETLLQRAVRKFSGIEDTHLLVVWGARKEEMEGAIRELEVDYVYNPAWEKGMGTSIKCGLKSLLQHHPDLESVMVTLVDQALVESNHLDAILEVHHTHPDQIIAASYEDVLGVPALFPKSLLPALQNIPDQKGAGALIKKMREQVYPFSLPEAAFDVDREEDYRTLLDFDAPFLD